MTKLTRIATLSLFLALAVAAPACKKQKPVTEPEPPAATTTPQQTAPKPTPPPAPPKQEVSDFKSEKIETGTLPTDDWVAEMNAKGVLRTVYFQFDSYDLDDQARAVLQLNAEWLTSDGAQANIRVEGHCDERGTIEYNLALGERRASAVRDYLVSLGVDAYRIRIVSFGEEVPVDPGHDESAWTKNRRGEFVIES